MRVCTHMYEYEHRGLIPFSIPQEAWDTIKTFTWPRIYQGILA